MPLRLHKVIACLLGAFAIGVAPVLATDGTLELAPKTSEEPNAPAEPKLKLYAASKALVIGIDAYGGSGWFAKGSGWPKLSMAVKDAEEIAKALTAKGFVVTLKKDLNSTDLDQAFRQFLIGEGADPEARLLVWFAGHGHTIGGEGYLVAADAPDPDASDIEFRSKALSLRRFGEYMREARAKHVLAVFDSCFGGSVFNVARARPPRAITLATTQTVRQFISSGDSNQVVSDDGAFRRLFIDVIEGREHDADANRDGYITGTELGLFVSDKLTNYSEKGQTPRYGKLNAQGYDRGDFVLEQGRLSALPSTISTAAPSPGGSVSSTPSEAERAWGLVQSSDSVAVLEAFRKQYGTGNALYDQLAVNRIAAIGAAEDSRKARETEHARQEAERLAKLTAAGIAQAVEAKRKEEKRLAMLADEEKRESQGEARDTPPGPKSGETFRDCPQCPEMVIVPAGEFTMGSPASEKERKADEGPQRKVTISAPLAVSKYEATRDQFGEFVAATGHDLGWSGLCWAYEDDIPAMRKQSFRNPGYSQEGNHPAVCVTWNDATAYAVWLSEKTGKHYRLLTEAEWEYAARAGTTSRYHFGDASSKLCEFANGPDQRPRDAGIRRRAYSLSCKDGHTYTAPVGTYNPNAFGLYDMHGNAAEWVEDCYRTDCIDPHPNSDSRLPDRGPASLPRVLRGGSWYDAPASLRSAARNSAGPDQRSVYYGFRVGRSLD